MTKQEFLSNWKWASIRWNNVSLDKDTVSSLYEDYKGFSYNALAKALRLIYNNGATYLELPKLYKLTKDLYNDELLSRPQLDQPKNVNGLNDYLKANNFKSIKDAIRQNRSKK